MSTAIKHFASGNEAVIDAALAAGCHFFAGYPVTPATEVLEAAAEKFPQHGRVMVPTEGEIAAIHMVAGASLAVDPDPSGCPARPGQDPDLQQRDGNPRSGGR